MRPRRNIVTELTLRTGFRPAALFEPAQDLEDALPRRKPRTRYDMLVAVRNVLHARAHRERHFNAKLFSDPAWDILLELYGASLAQRRLTVTRLSERSRTALTTALRWIVSLEKEGLVEREFNPLDGRQVFIVLSDAGVAKMEDYFESFPANAVLL
jgi:DNA-binding MarR family transcriptional regulator